MKKSSILSHSSKEDVDDNFRPQLTSLIDVMTILLVFLIQNFSVEGQLITPSKDVVLAKSTSTQKPEQNSSVVLSATNLIVNGDSIETTQKIEFQDSLFVPQLADRLKQLKEKNSSSSIILEVDKTLPFSVVKKVVYTCNRVDYKDFSVLLYGEKDE